MNLTEIVVTVVLIALVGCNAQPVEKAPAVERVPLLVIPTNTPDKAGQYYPPSPLQCLGILMREGFPVLPKNSDVQRWETTAPLTGEPVVDYVWQVQWHGGPYTLMSIATISPTDALQIRCAGVDTLGRQGEWSEWGTP